MATKEQMKVEFSYFGEVWNFFKRHYEVRADDEYWETVISEAGAIVQKYNNLPLCKDITLAVIDELERKGKELKDGQNEAV